MVWLVLGIACLGPVLGLLWWAISPVVPGVVVQVGIYPRETQPAGYITTDAYFAILTAVVGVVVALLVRRQTAQVVDELAIPRLKEVQRHCCLGQ